PLPPAPRTTTAPIRSGYYGSSTFPSPTAVTAPAPASAPNVRPIDPIGLSPFASQSATSQPGGISLSRAAAERMRLNLSLEGAFVRNGRIVLSGKNNAEATLDAALFLTGLRATCQNRDPYFSLDPDDVSAWLHDTKQAGQEFFAHIRDDIGW